MEQRILVDDYTGHPFQVQLSRKLAERGYHVLHLYAGQLQTPHGRMQVMETDPPTFKVKALCTRQPVDKYAFAKRWFQEREYGRLTIEAIEKFKPDMVISANMPLEPQAMVLDCCQKRNIRFIFWLQDIISVGTKLILARKFSWLGTLVGTYYYALEKRLLAKSDHIVSITPDFAPFLMEAGVPDHRVTIIPNWAPLEEIPVVSKVNPWSQANGLAEKFCFLYSGTLGLKHNPDLLLQLALHFKDDPQVVVYVGSEGLGAQWLLQRKQELNLTNLFIQGYQSMELFPQVLGAGDVLIGILDPDAGVYSVPSKVLSYHAAKKPLLLAVPSNNLAARIVEDNQTGFVVPSDVPSALIRKAEQLYTDPVLRQRFAENARKYAEEHFDIDRISDCFANLITQLSAH